MDERVKHIMVHSEQMKAFSSNPLVFRQGNGVWLTDIHGKKYIDGLAGVFVVNVGHGCRAVIEAMGSQARELTFTPPLNSINDPALELADVLLQITPGGFSSVKFTSSGSQATEAAMKMARQYQVQAGHPRKYKIVSRYLAFHGATFGSMSASGIAGIKNMFEPGVDGFVHVPPPYCYRCPVDKSYPGCGITCAELLERTIKWEGPDSVAAVIIDPVMCSSGILPPPKEYLPMVRDICDRHRVLLIFDEVIVGFGRMGTMFAYELYQARPDILALGKGISSGYSPTGAIVVHENVANAFWGESEDHLSFLHGHSFDNNPLTASVCVANIREMIDRKLVENASSVGLYLGTKLRDLYKYPIVGDVRGGGLLFGIEFVKDGTTREPFDLTVKPGQLIGKAALDKGLVLRLADDWIGIGPPLCISMSEIDELCTILESSIAEVSAKLLG